MKKIAGIEYVERKPLHQTVESANVMVGQVDLPSTNEHLSALLPQVIVCLHGIGGDHNSFAPQLDALSDTYHVISWNMPGYRHSEALATTTFETLLQALLNFIDQLGIAQVHLVGQSIGGMLAQEFALTHPDRILSLVLIATTSAFGGRDESFKQRFLQARLAPLEAGCSLADLASEFVPEIIGPRCSASAREAAIASMGAVPESSYRAVLGCLVTFNRRNDFNQITHPVCLIAGSADNNAPVKSMRKMADALSTAEFHEIDQAGHLVNIEAPNACNDIISAFLTKVPTNQELAP